MRNNALSKDHAVWVGIVAFAMGALLAWLVPRYQFGVVGSLTLADIIPAHPASVMSDYYLSTFSMTSRIGALLLELGLPQDGLDFVFGSLSVGLRVAGGALLIFGFTRRPWFALTASIFCFATNFLTDFFISPDHGGGWTGLNQFSRNTYANIAFAGSLFVFGALAAKLNLTAGITIGLLIGAHIDVGTFLAGLTLFLIVIGRLGYMNISVPRFLTGFAIGLSISIVFAIHFLVTRRNAADVIDFDVYRTYMKIWEDHRNRPFLIEVYELIAIYLVFLTVLFLLARDRAGPLLSSSLLILSVLSSSVLYFIAHFPMQDMRPADFWPWYVRAALLGRIVNVHGTAIGPVFIAAIALALDRSIRFRARWVALAACALIWPFQISDKLVGRWAFANYGVGLTVPQVAGLLAQGAEARLHGTSIDDIPPNGEFWRKVRELHLHEPVLTAPNASTWAQLYGHLPVVLDTNLVDLIGYVPSAGTRVKNIIERGYGLSFSNPARDHIYFAHLAEMDGRDYWATLSPDDWLALAKELGFSSVIAPRDWKMSIPAALFDDKWALYYIP